MLRLEKVAEWRTAAGRGASKFGLLGVLSPQELVVWYIKRIYLDVGSSSGIYVVRLGKRPLEVQRFQLMNDLEESGAFGLVRVVTLGDTVSYFTVGSSGVVNGLGCRYSGASLRFEDGHVICLCDGYDNCNGTSNSRYTLYDPLRDVIIHGGDCTGFYLWLLRGDHSDIVARLSLRGFETPFMSHLAVVPTDGDELVVVAGNSPPGKGIVVGKVNLDDLAENGPSSYRLDELPSWRGLFELEDPISCITCSKSDGRHLLIAVDRGGVVNTEVVDLSGRKVDEVPGVAIPLPIGSYAWLEGEELVTRGGDRLKVGGRGRLVSSAGNLVASLDTLSGQAELFAMTGGNQDPALPVVDVERGTIRAVRPGGGQAALAEFFQVWTRLAYSYYQEGCTQTLPLLSQEPRRGYLEGEEVPSPPSEGRPTLSLFPALTH